MWLVMSESLEVTLISRLGVLLGISRVYGDIPFHDMEGLAPSRKVLCPSGIAPL